MPFGFRRLKASIPRSRLTRHFGLQPATAQQTSIDSITEYDPEQPCPIESLPDELLAQILLLLPWRDRLINVERVSKRWRWMVLERGWTNFTVFDNEPYDDFVITEQPPPKSVQRRKLLYLLSRCGRHLLELTLISKFVLSILPRVLELCPNVLHLHLWLMKLDTSALDCIREALGGRLRSLEFDGCLRNPKITTALNRLFTACPRLEYLNINEDSEEFEQVASGLLLPPSLRYLAFYEVYDSCQYSQKLLREENCRALAPNLRGLRLRLPTQFNASPFPHLVELVNLTYLGFKVTSANGSSLRAALDAMPQLKALEISIGNDSGVIDDFSAHCTQLEHLSLTLRELAREDLREMHQQLGRRLANLRSLHVCDCRIRRMADWGWLQPVVARGRLEHVHIWHTESTFARFNLRPGAPVPHEIIRNCKNLHTLCIDKYSMEESIDYEGIVDAAVEAEAGWKRENSAAPMPRIRIWGVGKPETKALSSYHRIEWRGDDKRAMPENALFCQYQYGMLSAGAPKRARLQMDGLV